MPPTLRARPLAIAALFTAVAALPGPVAARAPNAAEVGAFSRPFEEPGPRCTRQDSADPEKDGPRCKPAAVTTVVLSDGRVLYWDGLEGTERVELSTANEIGDVAGSDQSRVLDLRGPSRPSWSSPRPVDGGANPRGKEPTSLVPDAPGPLGEALNHPGGTDGALFCASQVLLADGRVLAAGGTDFHNEPHVPGTKYGVAELEGLRNTRIFDPATNRWRQTGAMRWGRWYPSLVTLPNGTVFGAGGVTKLIKPLYPERSPPESGRNVVQTETYDPRTGRWRYNGPSADRSLPLYPRLHLLPDGTVYYDAAGQAFNPMGQGYDEALWNVAAVYEPRRRTWRDLGVPGLGSIAPGFRGSTFSMMLPLEPPYTNASFLTAGGVVGTSPGTYLATADSRIATVDTAAGTWTTRPTAPLNEPRWFSTAVLLPTGQVMAFSGASADEVVGPGTGFPVTRAELFDPERSRWLPMADAVVERTYHNTAVLLPDGRVLVGGHAPIPTGYGFHQTLPAGTSDNHRNQSFQIYRPPYLFWGDRPEIARAPKAIRYGRRFTVATPDAGSIESVVLVRYPAVTHLVDGDQRSVVLRVVTRGGGRLTVAAPPRAAVAPPGPYMLFVNERTARELVPSVAARVFVRR